jgi:hypothetical protein
MALAKRKLNVKDIWIEMMNQQKISAPMFAMNAISTML